MVYIVDARNNIGHPTQKHDMVGRLIRNNKAKIIRRFGKNVIIVQLLNKVFDSSETIDCEFRIGIDPGYKHIGFALFKIFNFKIIKLLSGELESRTSQITMLLSERKMYRNNRRGNRRKNVIRKFDSVKFRKPIWKNRAKHMFQPTHKHLIMTHINLLTKLFMLIPEKQSKIHMEYNKFDLHKIFNPKIYSFYYQLGAKYGFQNTADYVRYRDNYRCQLCNINVASIPNEVHHIIFRSNGGSNRPDNLILLCPICHKKIHSGKSQCPIIKNNKQFRDAGVLNSCMKYLFNFIENSKYMYIQDTFGYITKTVRLNNNISKSHANDATIIAFSDNLKMQNIQDYSWIDLDISLNFKQYRRHVRNHVHRHEDRKYYIAGRKKCVAWNRNKRETQSKPSLTDVNRAMRAKKLHFELIPRSGKAIRRKLNTAIKFRPGDIIKHNNNYSVCKGWASTQGKVIFTDGGKAKSKDCKVIYNNSGIVAY